MAENIAPKMRPYDEYRISYSVISDITYHYNFPAMANCWPVGEIIQH